MAVVRPGEYCVVSKRQLCGGGILFSKVRCGPFAAMIAKVGFGLFRPINGGFLSRPQGQVLLNRLGLFNKTLPILTFSIKEMMPIIDWVLSLLKINLS